MSNFHRVPGAGETYFFTLVTHDRHAWLCHELARTALRTAIVNVRQKHPFAMDACVLLPNHLHCIWTLPKGDRDYAMRWKLIKSYVTKRCGKDLKQQAGSLWQQGFIEHQISDEIDFLNHCDYIHYNPVRHQLCNEPQEWEFSSVHRFMDQGIYQSNWGKVEQPIAASGIWDV